MPITTLSGPSQAAGQVAPYYARVLDVSPSYGDYPTITAALARITLAADAAANNRYLIRVHSGVYAEAVTMQAFVDIEGVGAAEDVVIRMATAVVTLAANSVLRNVTLDLNTPAGAINMVGDGGAAVTACRLEHCAFSITTPGAFAHRVVHLTAASTVTLEECSGDIGGAATAIVNVQAAATVILRRNALNINTATGFVIRCTAAATINSRNNSYRGIGALITASLGTVLFEKDSNDTEAVSVVTGGQTSWKVGFATYEVFRGFRIGDALAAAAADTPAAAAGNRYVVLVHPGTYSEALAPTGDHITIVGVGTPGNVIITQAAGNLVSLNGRTNLVFKNLTLQLTAALAAEALVDLNTAANTGIRLEDVTFDITGAAGGNALYALNSSSAFAHTVTLLRCSGTIAGTGVSAFVRETTGTLTATLEACLFVMNSANGFVAVGAATVLTVNATECSFLGTGALVSTGAAAHRITVNGGEVDVDAASVHGAGARTVWKTARETYTVVAGMLIQHALDAVGADTPAPAAGVRYVIRLLPGTYSEALAPTTDHVTVEGVGAAAGVIVTQAAGNLVTLNGRTNFVLRNLTLQLTAALAGEALIDLTTAANTGLRLEDVVLDITGAAGANALYGISSSSAFAHTVTLLRCAGTIAGTGVSGFVRETTGTLTATLQDCLLTMNSANGFIAIGAATVLTFTAFGGVFTGTGGLVSTGAAAHRITLNGGQVDLDAASVHGAGARTAWKTARQTYTVVAGLMIQHAIDAAAADTPAPAVTAPYVVLVYAGVYTEALTGATYANVEAVEPGSVIVRQADATVLTIGASNIRFKGLIFDLNAPTLARNMVVEGGVPTARTGIVFEDCTFTITTPGGLVHRVLILQAASGVTLLRCSATVTDGANPGIQVVRNDTAGATLALTECNLQLNDTAGFIVFSSVAGTWTLRGNQLSGTAGGYSVSLGTVRGYGNSITTTAAHAVTGGSVTEKSGRQLYQVWVGMTIGHALAAAAADTPAPSATALYTVQVGPGVYTEVLIMLAFIGVIGSGAQLTIIRQTDANVVDLGLATNCVLAGVELNLVTPTVGRQIIRDQSGAVTGFMIRDCVMSITTPAALAHVAILLNLASSGRIERVRISIGGTGVGGRLISNDNAAGDIVIKDCDLEFNNADGFGVIQHSIAGATTRVINCRLTGTAPHLTCSAGVLRVEGSSYRSVARSATGSIVDESVGPAAAPYHVVRLDRNSIDNVASRVAVGGAVALGGSGQLRLRINDNAVDAAGVENNADAAGSLDSSVDPARTPRYVTTLSANAFRATTTMFLGLRAAVGAAVPGMAENHAGFIWTGAAFNASSSDGAGVGQTTALVTPSTGAQHSLEVIVLGGVQVEFYVDGVLVATHTGVGVPTSATPLDWQEYEISSGAGGATTSDVTLRDGFLQECPA